MRAKDYVTLHDKERLCELQEAAGGAGRAEKRCRDQAALQETMQEAMQETKRR